MPGSSPGMTSFASMHSRDALMIPAATAYVALTFVAGFIVGMLREFIVRPLTGETAALLIEAPLMLIVTFFAARWALTKMMPSADVNSRFKMGLIAFVW